MASKSSIVHFCKSHLWGKATFNIFYGMDDINGFDNFIENIANTPKLCRNPRKSKET